MKANPSVPLIITSIGLLIASLLTGCMQDIRLGPTLSVTNSTTPRTTTSILTTSILVTVTSQPSQTSTPTKAASSTPKPLSPTPLPTLTAEKAKSLAFSLLRTNGGCHLPCIWGFSPGSSSVASLSSFLSSFGSHSTEENYIRSDKFTDSGGLFISSLVDNKTNEFSLNYYWDGDNITQLALWGTQKSGYEYSFDGGDYDQLFNYYFLPQILSRYGHPASVYVGTWTEGAILGGPYIPFSVVLYYPDMGFLIEYLSPNKKVGQYLQGCPQRSYFQLTTVSPDQDISLEKILSNSSGEGITAENIDYFKPLDEATGMTIDEFYQKFKDPNNMECLETPIDLWGP